MNAKTLAALMTASLLGACSGGGALPPPKTGFTPATRPSASAAGLIGADARGLQRQFGQPRLDIRDPTAHKLQFANDRCVLDAYLYAPGEDKEPLVTFVEARTPQGMTLDVNSCAKLLREK